MTAWCHLDTNECTSNDITYLYIWDLYIGGLLASAFKSDFGLTGTAYWSSSPLLDNDQVAWGFLPENDNIGLNNDYRDV